MDRAGFAVSQWAREMPEVDTSAMEIVGRLSELWLSIDRDHLAPMMRGFGLQGGEFDVIATLRRAGPPYALTPTQLYEAAMMSSGGMTARLDRLEKSGLIRRSPNPEEDQRLVGYSPAVRGDIGFGIPIVRNHGLRLGVNFQKIFSRKQVVYDLNAPAEAEPDSLAFDMYLDISLAYQAWF